MTAGYIIIDHGASWPLWRSPVNGKLFRAPTPTLFPTLKAARNALKHGVADWSQDEASYLRVFRLTKEGHAR